MTDDLVKRLRQWGNFGCGHEASKTMHEAANRIEQLEAALQDIASGKYTGFVLTSLPPKDPAVERARAALGEKKDG